MILFHLHSFFCARPFHSKLQASSIYFVYFHSNIRPNYMILFRSFFLCPRQFDQKLGSPLCHYFFFFVHEHSTKVRCYSYSLIYSFLNCHKISFAIFMAVLPLYFFRSFSGSAVLIFIGYNHSSTTLIFHTL